MENMKFLCDSLKNLPINLKIIDIGLNDNNLGNNIENMMYLGDAITKLPNNL